MSELKRYVDLKRKVEQAQQNADRADGALEQVTKRLKNEFGCPTLAAAKKKLKLLEKQEERALTEFENAVEEFEEEWSDEST